MMCELIKNTFVNDEVFRLDFIWQSVQTRLAAPKAGQFFMVKPKRSGVFLGRPISVASWKSDTVSFLIARRGQGTQELAAMHTGDEAELIGPLGNAWGDCLRGVRSTPRQIPYPNNNRQVVDFLPEVKNSGKKPIALVGGGIGIAPLNALLIEAALCETSGYHFDVYAGFRTGFKNSEEKSALLGMCLRANKIVIATEDGKDGHKGRIPDFLEPEQYAAVCACGPEPMLKAVAAKCKTAGVPCFVSMEKRMACGVGACLGCTVKTVSGNRRCCADGPIFKADEVIFDA